MHWRTFDFPNHQTDEEIGPQSLGASRIFIRILASGYGSLQPTPVDSAHGRGRGVLSPRSAIIRHIEGGEQSGQIFSDLAAVRVTTEANRRRPASDALDNQWKTRPLGRNAHSCIAA
jgi:hypothetical protein